MRTQGDGDIDILSNAADGIPELIVTGELDSATSPRLHAAVDAVVEAGTSKVVVDLGGVSFMSSAGIGVIIGLTKTLRERGGSLQLRHVSGRVRHVLDVTGVLSYLDIQ
jgi:anti-sigma B factor antagonist